MNDNEAAEGLAELGHPVRLAIVRLLVKAGAEGLTVNVLKAEVDCPGSTLSHHISHLMRAGLVYQEREGRNLHCHVEYERLMALVNFLFDECCSRSTNKGCC